MSVSQIPSNLLDAVPGLDPARLDLEDVACLWQDFSASARLRRILAGRLAAICDVKEVCVDVARLLTMDAVTMERVQRFAGAAVFAPQLRRRICRNQVEATKLMIDADAFAFAMKAGIAEADPRFTHVTRDDIMSVGRALYWDWQSDLNAGEVRLLELLHPMLRVPGLDETALAADIMPQAIGAVYETL